MKVLFRVDASVDIGTGHAMRCLALARELRRNNVSSFFVMRRHAGNLIDRLRDDGFDVHTLECEPSEISVTSRSSPQSGWLGGSWRSDCIAAIQRALVVRARWVIVDHYDIDSRWEQEVSKAGFKVLVIDDLADRPHFAHALLDQTFGREVQDYQPLVPSFTRLLLGTSYALLRPEFARARDRSLSRRAQPLGRLRLLLTMGGIDKGNVTKQILLTLKTFDREIVDHIDVLMGSGAPHLTEIQLLATTMPVPVSVHVDATDVADLMASADVAIGAAGGTAWERCCLGLPTIMLVLAENQALIAETLARAQAVAVIDSVEEVAQKLPALLHKLMADQHYRIKMSRNASALLDGLGLRRVVNILETVDD